MAKSCGFGADIWFVFGYSKEHFYSVNWC